MNLTNRSIVAAIWEFSSTLVQALLQFSILAVLARLIPPAEFGLYGITSMAISITFLFSELGTRQAIIRKKQLDDRFISSAFVLSILLGLIGTVIMWCLSPLIANFFHNPEVTNLLRVASLVLIINGYATVSTALLEKDLAFRKLALINVTSYLIGFGLVGLCLALLGLGAWAIVMASLFQSITRAIMLMFMTRQFPIRMGFSRQDFHELVNFGGGLTIANSFGNLAYYIDNVVVGRFLGSADLGLYQMAFQIMDLPRRFLGGTIDRVTFAALTQVLNDKERFRIGYLHSMEIANVLFLPVTVLFIVVAPETVKVILGSNWDRMILPLQILLTQIPLRASLRMTDNIGIAVGKVYNMSYLKFLYAVMISIAALIGTKGGLNFVALFVTFAVIINWTIMVRFTLRIVNASTLRYIKTWIPAAFLGCIVLIISQAIIEVMRNYVPSELAQLCITISLTGLICALVIWICPRVLGDVVLDLLVGFETRSPIFNSALSIFGRRIHAQRKPVVESSHI